MKPRFTLDGSVWFAQTVLAFVFFWVGSLRAMLPVTDLAHVVPWLGRVDVDAARWIGVAELVLALGVLVPAMMGFFVRLTELCALGLSVFCAAGALEHAAHGEPVKAFGCVALFAVALFVAWGRAFVAALPRRSWRDEDPSHSPYPDLAPDAHP